MEDGVRYEFKIESEMTAFALNQCKEKVKKALEMIGQGAVGHAKLACPVDTGLLRNSITHAVGGKTAITDYHADRGDKSGSYSGGVGNADELAVYVGTNVEYAIYVETGARGRRPVYFIKNAMANHISEYQAIMDAELKR